MKQNTKLGRRLVYGGDDTEEGIEEINYCHLVVGKLYKNTGIAMWPNNGKRFFIEPGEFLVYLGISFECFDEREKGDYPCIWFFHATGGTVSVLFHRSNVNSSYLELVEGKKI